MHIVDVTLFYGREAGGVKTYLHAKHRCFEALKHIRHTMVVPHGSDLGYDPSIVGIVSMPFPFAPGYRLPVGRTAPILRQLKPDVIEVGDASYLAWEALRVGRELKIPVVGFYHSDVPRILGRRLGTTVEHMIEQYVAHLYRQFDLVIAPSRATARTLRDLGVDSVHCQRLGVDTAVFSPDRRDSRLRHELGLREETRLLVYVGRFSAEKNLPVLLQAVAHLGSNYHLLAIGGDCFRSSPDNVTFLPFERSRDKLARFLASCDVAVHAGDQETFGLSVLEAMASGIPVVGAARGGVAELVDAHTGALAAPGNPETLAAAIVELYENDVAQLGRNARCKMLRHFTWEQVTNRLLEVYTHLSARGAADLQLHANTFHAID